MDVFERLGDRQVLHNYARSITFFVQVGRKCNEGRLFWIEAGSFVEFDEAVKVVFGNCLDYDVASVKLCYPDTLLDLFEPEVFEELPKITTS